MAYGSVNVPGVTSAELAEHTGNTTTHITAAERAAWNAKADKVNGKGLSTNDYTTAEKNKLAGIEEGAQVNPDNASQSAAGLMSAADKKKLDGVASGATANAGTVTGVKINGTTKSPSSGVVDLGNVLTEHQDISGKVDKVSGKGLSTNDYTTAEKNKLAGIAESATANTAASAAPKMDGAAAVGTSAKYAREDHVHPTDTSRAAASHNHGAGDINSGTLGSDRLPTVPVSKGGTGATTAAAARTNLEVYSKSEVDNLWWLSKTNVSLGLSPLMTTVEVIGSNLGTITARSSSTSVTTSVINSKTVAITAIAKGNGGATVTISNTATNTSKTVIVIVEDEIPSRTLSDNTPDGIQAAARAGIASALWSVGDKIAPIAFNNVKVGSLSMNGLSACAFIIGFNHNSGIEGSGVHFQFGETTDGTNIAFADGGYSNVGSSAAFRMNTTETNSGGWQNSYMRKTICPAFLSALPTEWQNVIPSCMKYSDNTGGGNDTASYVTSATDKIFLLAEFEVFGSRSGANSAEKNYQKQYAYYANGNSKVKRKHSGDSAVICQWWLRSVDATNTWGFYHVITSDRPHSLSANCSRGFAPGFKVA